MPRPVRLILNSCPHHIIQRGHNRQVVFAGNDDYLYYLDTLQEWKSELGCKVYAYCLMTNHVHLVVDPGNQSENLSLLMKRLAGRQTRFVNKTEKKAVLSGKAVSNPARSTPMNICLPAAAMWN